MRCSNNMKRKGTAGAGFMSLQWCSCNGFPDLQAQRPLSLCLPSPTITFSHSPTEFPFQRSLLSDQHAEPRSVSLLHVISAVREGVSKSLSREHIGVLQKEVLCIFRVWLYHPLTALLRLPPRQDSDQSPDLVPQLPAAPKITFQTRMGGQQW